MIVNQMKQIVFILLIFFVIIAVFAAISYQDFFVRNLLWLSIGIIVLYVIWRFDFIIMMKDYERAVIFRFGKLNRVGGPGWALIIPPIESFQRVDLRTATLDVPKQEVVTKDNIELKIDAIVYLKVKKDNQSVTTSVLEVADYKEASRLYVIALIRDIIGSMELKEVIANVETLNEQLKEGLKKISEGWGVAVDAVEIKDVQIPKTVLDAMHLEKAAVQQKLARIEGALAHQAEIDAVKTAAEQLSDKALAYYYIRALEKIGESRSTKFIFPMEITKLAESITGKMAKKEPSEDLNELFEKYAPALKKYLKEAEAKPKKKKKGK